MRFAVGLFIGVVVSPPAQAAAWPSWPLSSKSAPAPDRELTNAELYQATQNPSGRRFTTFLKPNELEPFKMLPITDQAPSGTYIVVGTERGFIGTAINPQITRTLFVDRDPAVIFFVRFNIALLKVSKNHEDYLWLRTVASAVEIENRFREHHIDLTSEHVRWFLWSLREQNGGDLLIDRHHQIDQNSNYAINKELCERLIAMARQNLLTASVLDLTEEKDVARWTAANVAGPTVALIDVSNVWWSRYAGVSHVKSFVHALAENLVPRSIVVVSHIGAGLKGWRYLGFSAHATESVTGWREIRDVLLKIEKDVYEQRSSKTFGRLIGRKLPAPTKCEVLFTPSQT